MEPSGIILQADEGNDLKKSLIAPNVNGIDSHLRGTKVR